MSVAMRTLNDRWKGKDINNQKTYQVIKDAIEEYDLKSNDFEMRWGIGRLPNLVESTLRSRFWAQIERLNQAIRDNNPTEVQHQVKVTLRGWEALEKRAEERKAKQLTGIAWTATSTDGTKTVCIVMNEHEIPAIKESMPDADVFSVREVANIMAAWTEKNDLAKQVKDLFPGAHVTTVQKTGLEGGWIDDEIPF